MVPPKLNGRVRIGLRDAWINTLTWIFNIMVDFVLEKDQFRCFNWFVVTTKKYAIVIGYFWLRVGPKEGKV